MGEVARRIDRAAEKPPNEAHKCAEALFHCLATYHAQQAGAFVALRLRCFLVERPPTDWLRVRIKVEATPRGVSRTVRYVPCPVGTGGVFSFLRFPESVGGFVIGTSLPERETDFVALGVCQWYIYRSVLYL